MLRFALLRHECPADYRDGPHWDLMLERPGTDAERRLATWSLLTLPGAWGEPTTSVAGAIGATQLPDHRADYLDYEGPVSGNRGRVSRIARGQVEWLETSDSLCRVRLSSESTITGTVTLEAMRETEWLLSVS